MSIDPMADAIAEKQRKGWRSQYSPADLDHEEHHRKIYEEREGFKSLMLALLKEDNEFRRQIKRLFNKE